MGLTVVGLFAFVWFIPDTPEQAMDDSNRWWGVVSGILTMAAALATGTCGFRLLMKARVRSRELRDVGVTAEKTGPQA